VCSVSFIVRVFLCDVLFECGVILWDVCYLCVLSYGSTTAPVKNIFAVKVNIKL
jgi:hypothetical protein